MKRFVLCLVFLSSVQFCAIAQNWQSVGTLKFNHGVNCLFSDTANGNLYATGYYWLEDTSSAYGLSELNGAEWQNAFSACGVGASKVLNKFQTDFYLSYGPYLLKWNNTDWDTVATTDGGIYSIYNDGDSVLYILGLFNNLNSLQVSNIAKFDGTIFSPLDATVWSGGGVNCMYRFQNKLYFGGGFYNTTNNIWRIGRWDGVSWHQLDNGITGSLGAAFCMEEYNGELYVGGYMETLLGNPGNYIARWDGSNWSQVGGGVSNGQVFNMKVFNGNLWVVGQFSSAGGIPAAYIARYNGFDWCSVGLFDNAIEAIEVHNGELYIGGNFWTADGDSVNKVVKWIGGNFADSCGHLNTGINTSIKNSFSVYAYPNPATTNVTFQVKGNHQLFELIIYDQFGREVWRKQSDEDTVQLSTEGFLSGMYFYRIEENNEIKAAGKLIVE